ncbi:MAG: QueT transporter family protein [Christensenellaceae bacterium]
MTKFPTKKLCRSGVIAALYAVLCWALGELSFGPLQIRPAEALCLLPLFFVEAVPALYVGCMLANLLSLYGALDIFVGSLATLFAAVVTYLIGKTKLPDWLKIVLGGLPVVLFNAFLIPWVMILGGLEIAYWLQFASMLLTETLWVYLLGTPLFFAIKRLRQKRLAVLL